jgi:hypothetical protein
MWVKNGIRNLGIFLFSDCEFFTKIGAGMAVLFLWGPNLSCVYAWAVKGCDIFKRKFPLEKSVTLRV